MNARVAWLALFALAVLLLVPLASATSAPTAVSPRYTPVAGDHFDYFEVITVNNGVGNYSGYQDWTFVNGTVQVNATAVNGTESAYYDNTYAWEDNEGDSDVGGANGVFTFSDHTFEYVSGSDGQTGYTSPIYLWFLENTSLAQGSTYYDLNTEMSILSTNYTYATHATGAGYPAYVRTIEGQGSGSYQRNDAYGLFNAQYTWQSYYDVSTGYIVGYQYTEQDSDSSGDGFTYTDTLYITSSSYTLTANPAPPATSSSSSFPWTLVIVAVVVLVLIIVLLVVLLRRRTPRPAAHSGGLPQHSGGGAPMRYTAPPPGPSPTPINLSAGGQPAVQQIVIEQTVKVNCKYCGTLIDTTDTVCPKCGAPRA